eukprot:582534-Prymnesium_polylepis.1
MADLQRVHMTAASLAGYTDASEAAADLRSLGVVCAMPMVRTIFSAALDAAQAAKDAQAKFRYPSPTGPADGRVRKSPASRPASGKSLGP